MPHPTLFLNCILLYFTFKYRICISISVVFTYPTVYPSVSLLLNFIYTVLYYYDLSWNIVFLSLCNAHISIYQFIYFLYIYLFNSISCTILMFFIQPIQILSFYSILFIFIFLFFFVFHFPLQFPCSNSSFFSCILLLINPETTGHYARTKNTLRCCDGFK